ncbi:hypothetical protein TanjilG_07318 [Lupinus angustifolius]|uniref:C2 domain-containing protein n=1 Tax=Lupinus angustifolius TaxID=3871 RepID=A0A394DID9_LUPAN|nr:PREDICTED: uncharacterized protein LOC109337961 [Lupinus angustifolius]OIW20227.1 hypothetical protein TanjilG_07318 [Lupinus angustifolius]
MASPYEVEVKIASAHRLKNVNWRHGATRPYAVVWVDPNNKFSTRVDESGDTEPNWDQNLLLPLPLGPIENFTLYLDIVHAGSEDDTKPLIGSARLKLADVIDYGGIGERVSKTLNLTRPSGRPHGEVEVKVVVKDRSYHASGEYYTPPYGVPPSRQQPPREYGHPNAGPQYESSYYSPAPQSGYPYAGGSYGQGSYGDAYNEPLQTASYGQGGYGYAAAPVEEKKSKFGGMGTGLAVGALAGVVGGIALAEGADYIENKIADDAAEKVEDDIGYDNDDGYDEDDF